MKSIITLLIVAAIGILEAQAQTIFSFTGSVQTYTVPVGVSTIEIDAQGAAGGDGTSTLLFAGMGGLGAQMIGEFAVTPGQELTIVVGEKGLTAVNTAGGGGGSFVWDTTTEDLLIAAGGGGGAGSTNNNNITIVNGLDASITEDGINGVAMPDGAGLAGSGGVTPTTVVDYASGGAGWIGNGADGTLYSVSCINISTGGLSPVNGATGGTAGNDGVLGSRGGYGGGGGSNGRCAAVGGGGGGGYSGGGAGGEFVSDDFSAGGGGGSFNSGTNQMNMAGAQAGNGIVSINAAPIISCPSTIIVSNDAGVCGAIIILPIITAEDFEDGTLVTTQISGPTSGSLFPVGISTIELIATDTNGLSSTCSYEVIVNDEETPEVTCPANSTVTIIEGEMYEIPDFIAQGDATSADNCVVDTFVQSPASGTMFSAGMHDVSFTATDDAGNNADCTFTITIEETLRVKDNSFVGIILYPNPVSDILIIENSRSSAIQFVEIYNMLGATVLKIDGSLIKNQINVSMLAAGNYIVKFTTVEGQLIKQLIKK